MRLFNIKKSKKKREESKKEEIKSFPLFAAARRRRHHHHCEVKEEIFYFIFAIIHAMCNKTEEIYKLKLRENYMRRKWQHFCLKMCEMKPLSIFEAINFRLLLCFQEIKVKVNETKKIKDKYIRIIYTYT